MAYSPTTWQDGVTPATAALMNKIEQELVVLDTRPGTEIAYEGDYVPATEYQDGDVVVKDGIAYLCVGGPTTIAPDPTPWGAAALGAVSRVDPLAQVLGFVNWLCPPELVTGAAAPVSQTIHAGYGLWLPAGAVITNVVHQVQTPSVGTVTGAFVGICNRTNMLAQSNNLGAGTQWAGGGAGLGSAPLSAPYTIPADGIYYPVLLINGAYTTTSPVFTRTTTLAGSTTGVNGVWRWGRLGTGQIALPANGAPITFSYGGYALWAAFS
jgi:hypothetical protein